MCSAQVLASILVLLLAFTMCSIAEARTWSVQVDALGDAPTIQAAIDSAAVGDTVLVGPGTYTWTAQGPVYSHSMLSLKPGLVLRGAGEPGDTILDAEAKGRLALLLDVGDQVRIENLTFQNGRSASGLAGNVFVGTHGGALYIWGNSSPSIQNCVFLSNKTIQASYGGAVYSEGTIRLQDCEFIENTSGIDGAGGGVYSRGRAEIISCVFKRNVGGGDNLSSGSAIYSLGGSFVSDCLFEGNRVTGYAGAGSGAITETGPGSIENCTFLANETRATVGVTGGAAVTCNSGCTVSESVFIGNRAQAGGGIAAGAISCDDCTVERSTFLLNEGISPTPHLAIGAVYFRANGTLSNSIIANNIGRAVGGLATATTRCSNLYANTPAPFFGTDGGGNFSLDPGFCFPPSLQGVDVSLQTSSPCAPGNHPAGTSCGLIGAGPVNCATTSVKELPWSQVKSLYRR